MNWELIMIVCLAYSAVFGGLFILYVTAIIIPFARAREDAPGDPGEYTWHFAIPCRDEEAVIGQTLTYLSTHFPGAHVWVVDDDSEDATAAIVRAAAAVSPEIHLVQRRLPEARTGKADALNQGWREILATLPEGSDLSRHILTVVDADGRPSPNMLRVCAGSRLFGAEDVAAVQVEVRMSNRGVRRPFPAEDWYRNLVARTFVRMQDLEFRGAISAIQMSRSYTRTVNVGGNGQLARFSALIDIADERGPWRGALLEDFELGLHLLLAGWRNAYTASAWVDQEALYSLRRFLTQRARWAQGTMQCLRYLPRVWRNHRIGNVGAMEISYFLIQPWLQLLGTVLYPIPLLVTVLVLANNPQRTEVYLSSGGWFVVIALVLFLFAQFAIWGPIYRYRSEPEATVLTGIGWGLSYVPFIYLSYLIVWKAFWQFARRQSGWAKTVRNAEVQDAQTLVARLK